MDNWTVADLLPGLYTALLATALGRILARWFEPVPLAVWGIFAAVVLVLFAPVLFGGSLLLPLDNLRGFPPFEGLPPVEPHGNFLQGDLIQLIAPSAQLVRRELLEGRWPLWNDLAGAGLPLLADPQAQTFQPLTLLALPFATLTAPAVVAAMRVLLALVFTYLLLRRQTSQPGAPESGGRGAGAALVGALAFGLGGFLLLWLGWPLANTAALLPVVLYGLRRLADGVGGGEERRRDVVLVILAIGALLLAGHPETILYALTLAGAFFVSLLLEIPASHLRRRLVVRAGGALLVAACGTAPVTLPAALYLPETARAGMVAEAAGRATDPEGSSYGAYVLETLVPVAVPHAFGDSRFVHYWGRDNSNEDAAGFVGTAALLAALLTLWPSRYRLPQERLMLAATGLALLVMVQPPALTDGLRQLPVLGAFCAHGNHRLLLVVAFGLAYLAACTVERHRRGQGAPLPALLLTAVVLGGVIFWASHALANPRDPELLEVLRLGWLHWHLRFLVLATLVLAALHVLRRHPRPESWLRPLPRLLAAALPLLVAGELLLAHRPVNPPMPKRLALPRPAALDFLAEQLERDPQARFVGLGRAMPPNLATLYGLADARTYNPVEPAAVQRLLAPALAEPRSNVPEIARPEHPVLDLLSVRYVLTAPGAALPPPLELVFDDASGQVYRRPTARPRLWRAAQGERGELTLERLESSRLTARVELAEGQPMAASVYRQGGAWRLVVDGEARATVAFEGALLGFSLPAGRHRLDLLYRPPGLLAGSLLAALATALAGLWLWPPPRAMPTRNRERRGSG